MICVEYDSDTGGESTIVSFAEAPGVAVRIFEFFDDHRDHNPHFVSVSGV